MLVNEAIFRKRGGVERIDVKHQGGKKMTTTGAIWGGRLAGERKKAVSHETGEGKDGCWILWHKESLPGNSPEGKQSCKVIPLGQQKGGGKGASALRSEVSEDKVEFEAQEKQVLPLRIRTGKASLPSWDGKGGGTAQLKIKL